MALPFYQNPLRAFLQRGVTEALQHFTAVCVGVRFVDAAPRIREYVLHGHVLLGQFAVRIPLNVDFRHRAH